MLQRFIDFVNQQHLFTQDEEVLLAISGGRDSVAMFHLMSEAGFQFSMAHCNFHLRGHDSDRDEHFVRQLAQNNNVPLFVRQFNTQEEAAHDGLSIEEEARLQRYGFFYELMREGRFSCVATAHHLNDSIETVFLNLLRGTGISGLHGIQPRSSGPLSDGGEGRVVHPMLCFTREEIDGYVKRKGIQYVEDYTNQQALFRRNQIRHQLVPLLRGMEPRFEQVMADNIFRFSEAEQIYRKTVEEERGRCVHYGEDGTAFLFVNDILSLSPRLTLLYEMLRPFGFGVGVVHDILRDVGRRSGQQYFSDTFRLCHDREYLLLLPLKGSDVAACPPRLVRREKGVGDGAFVSAKWKVPPTEAYFDAELLKQPLTMRHWRKGDRFLPFGMKGSQLLSDYFNDHKFTRHQREACWLLIDAEGNILWIVGHRASATASVTANTRRVLHVSLRQD
ncbi:MAG: tRNA lysidine(34) synthetase TilS [Bacteroidales bacterium]|nr:tRNA lysidine(34) synthetase TilS [Bacteroidales bacterium]